MTSSGRSASIIDPLDELLPGPVVHSSPAMGRARDAFEAGLRDLLAIPDAALERPWRWRPQDQIDADVRYGFFRVHESLEESVAAIAIGRSAAGDDRVGVAVPPLVAASLARWGLHGALLPLSAADLDADPGGGEWSIRRTLGHVLSVQQSYGWTSAWFLSRAGQPDAGEYAPEGALPPEPDEETVANGQVADVRGRLDGLIDAAAERFGGLDDAALAVPGRWSGLPVTVGFRLGRLGSHIREHTIQVDKALVANGRQPTEVERLARLTCESYGRLEATIFARPASDVERPLAGGPSAATIVERAAEEAGRIARSVREAATTTGEA